MINNKKYLQSFVVRTSFPPFTQFYKLFYHFSTKLMIYVLKRIQGVESIYLRRGAAKNEVVYGLSDIDITVFIVEKNSEELKKKVLRRYSWLSKFLPVFSDSPEETGIYTKKSFFKLHDENPFFIFRFQKGKSEWKHLYGKTILDELPDLEDEALYLPATEELKMWWNRLRFEFQRKKRQPEFMRKYLWYKAIADVSQVYLFIRQGERIPTRKLSLERMKKYLSVNQTKSIEKFQYSLERLHRKEPLRENEIIQLYIELATLAFHESEKKMSVQKCNKKGHIQPIRSKDLIIDKNTAALLKKVRTFIENEVGSYISGTALFSQVYLGWDALYNMDIDSLDLVLVLNKCVPFKKLKVLNTMVERQRTHQGINVFMLRDSVSFSIRTRVDKEAIQSPKTAPIFFALCEHAYSNKIDDDTSQKLQFDWNEAFDYAIRKRAEKIDNLILDKNLFKLSCLDFIRFFWSASRTKTLKMQLDHDMIYIPLTSYQIMMFLKEQYFHSSWISELHQEYLKEINGIESEAVRFFEPAIDFLKNMKYE